MFVLALLAASALLALRSNNAMTKPGQGAAQRSLN